MKPFNFPDSTTQFKAPKNFDGICDPIDAHVVECKEGPNDGARLIVVAWKPDEQDLLTLQNGGLVYLTCRNSLPPHFMTTTFKDAINPA